MKNINLLIFALVIIVSVLGLTMYLQQSPDPVKPAQETLPTPLEEPEKQAIVHYPVPTPKPATEQQSKTTEQAKPQETTPPTLPLPEKLPSVEQSDISIEEALGNLKLEKKLYRLLLIENFIQRLVTTIDNLTEKSLPGAHSPLQPPKDRFIASGTAEAPQTSVRNQVRYKNHVQLLESLDQDLIVKIYVHFYPLFQTAYEQLGYRNAYFNDRLVFVLEHLLATPQPPEPILLAQPSVLYVYADPLLEKLSAGQKILIRIGPTQREKVMQIFRKYRDQLVSLRP